MKAGWENGFVTARPPGSKDKVTARKRKDRAARYCCEGSVELRTAGTDVRTWGKLSDLSATGCYVEMRAAFPVGSRVGLVLTVQDVHLEMSGEVRVTYPFLGMGIAFHPLSQQAQGDLQKLLRALAPPSSSEAGSDAARASTNNAASGATGDAKTSPTNDAPSAAMIDVLTSPTSSTATSAFAAPPTSTALVADADRALHLLADHFQSHDVLTREEFLKLIPPDSSVFSHLIEPPHLDSHLASSSNQITLRRLPT